MHELPFDPLAWLDKYIAEQRCNVEVVEQVSGLSFAEVETPYERPAEAQAQVHDTSALDAVLAVQSLARKARTFS
jgi:hypothetical protein